jgi:hypothetical protein
MGVAYPAGDHANGVPVVVSNRPNEEVVQDALERIATLRADRARQ